jgi:hypothetical protein
MIDRARFFGVPPVTPQQSPIYLRFDNSALSGLLRKAQEARAFEARLVDGDV